MRPRTLLLFALAALLGAAVAVLPALAASPSEAKLEVNENCVEPDWPCWATQGSSQPASKVTIASGGSVTFADSKTAANIAWTGTAPTCESAVPVAPASPKTGWEGKCTFATPGTYKFESSTLFNDGPNTPNTKSWSKVRPPRPPPPPPAKAAQKAARPRAPPHRVPPQPAKARRDRHYPVRRGSARANGAAPSRALSRYQRPVPETASRSTSSPPPRRWRRPGTQRRWSGDS